MDVRARAATTADLTDLATLYRGLEAEQTALAPMWPIVDGLAEPAEAGLAAAVADPDRLVLVGTIDGVPVGFLVAGTAALLPQANGERVGQIQYVYTVLEARGVGVGEAMMEAAMDYLRSLGLDLFDAKVSPGHRLAKNFFEAAGFSARSIVMHHRDSGA